MPLQVRAALLLSWHFWILFSNFSTIKKKETLLENYTRKFKISKILPELLSIDYLIVDDGNTSPVKWLSACAHPWPFQHLSTASRRGWQFWRLRGGRRRHRFLCRTRASTRRRSPSRSGKYRPRWWTCRDRSSFGLWEEPEPDGRSLNRLRASRKVDQITFGSDVGDWLWVTVFQLIYSSINLIICVVDSNLSTTIA